MSAGDFLLALTHSAPPDEMPERILTCFWCCRDRRFLVAPSGLAAGQGCARRHHWGRSRLRTGQQIQIDPRLLRLAGGIPATGAVMLRRSIRPAFFCCETQLKLFFAFDETDFVERVFLSTRPMD